MPQFQLLEAEIAIQGGMHHKIHRDPLDNPITFPELLILNAMHGEGSIAKVYDTGRTVERTHADELDRLRSIYTDKLTRFLFPGAQPQLPVAGPYHPRPVLVPAVRGSQAPVNTIHRVADEPLEPEPETDEIAQPPPEPVRTRAKRTPKALDNVLDTAGL